MINSKSTGGVVVGALASHQCCLGSISRLGVRGGLNFLVLFSALRGFSLGTPVFPPPQKPGFDSIWFVHTNPQALSLKTHRVWIYARFARAYFIFWHFEDVLVLSTTWNDLFCRCVDDVSIWWQMLIFVLCPKRWFQFNSRIVITDFSSIMTLSNWKTIVEPRSYIFRWHSRFRRRRVCFKLPNRELRHATFLTHGPQ